MEDDTYDNGKTPDDESGAFTPARLVIALVLVALFGAALAFFSSMVRASESSYGEHILAGARAPQENIVVNLPNMRYQVSHVAAALLGAASKYGAWVGVRVSTDFSRSNPDPKKVVVSFYETETQKAADAKRCFVVELPATGFVRSVEVKKVSNDEACSVVDRTIDKLVDRFLVELFLH